MKRLDVLVASKFGISRSFATDLIKSDKVSSNGLLLKDPSKKFSDELNVFVDEKDLTQSIAPENLIPENIPLEIIFENKDILVVNKPSGMSVHTSQTEHNGTLTNALMYYLSSDLTEWGSGRPFVVHRLDKETSGVIITAKNRITQAFLMNQFKERTVAKKYIAIVEGTTEKQFSIEKSIARNKVDRKKMGIYENGRYALTNFKTISSFQKDKMHKYSLVEASPKTGRTHQIRVHLKSIGHPIVGDKIYNGEANVHMYLHSNELRIEIKEGEEMTFVANPPKYYNEFIESLTSI